MWLFYEMTKTKRLPFFKTANNKKSYTVRGGGYIFEKLVSFCSRMMPLGRDDTVCISSFIFP